MLKPLKLAALVIGVGAIAFVIEEARSQQAGSGTRGSATRPGTTRGSATQGRVLTYEEKLWNYLTKSRVPYRRWRTWPGKEQVYEGQSPHGAYLRMYINSRAAADVNDLADGSIIVKENYGQDQKTLMAITVMYKAKGYDPANNDWYWVKYRANGTVARTPADAGNKPIRGRFQSCIQCHEGADGEDLVFAND